MKKKACLLLFPLSAALLLGCANEGTSLSSLISSSPVSESSSSSEAEVPVCPGEKADVVFKNYEDGYLPYSTTNDDGNEKAHFIDKNGTPILDLSTLLRTDLLRNADFLKASEMEDYFAIAKETGFNSMDVVITWKEVEPKKNDYDFSDIKVYLDYAKKYDLKLNFVWYGSIVDGETHGANVPNYVLNNKKTYPVLIDLFDGGVYGRYEILDWSNSSLLDREQKAIYSLCNYVYEWTEKETIKDPVMMFQLGQGVDRFYKWRISQYTVPGSDSDLMSQEEAETMTNGYLNAMGKAVKYSKYKAITRSEFCEQSGVVNYVRNAKANEYVDIVSPTYLHDVNAMRNGIKSFSDEFEDMAVINAENWANDINYKAMLANISLGATGYTGYQLSGPVYYPELPNGALYGRYNKDGATLADRFSPKGSRVADTKSVMNALNNVFVPAATSKRANFASFGYDNRIKSESDVQKIYLNKGILIDYSKPTSSIGFAIYSDNYVYAYSKEDATMKFTNCTLLSASEGAFDESGEWNNASSALLAANTTLTLEAGKTYRVKVASVNKLPTSKELSAQGYYSTYDSIRSA